MTRLPTVGADDGNWGNILNDYLTQSHATDGTLKTDSVDTVQLKAGAVTEAALADNAVSGAKLQDGAVTSAKIDKLGQANGVASLDNSAQVPVAQIPDLSSTYTTPTTVAASYVPNSAKGAASGVASLDGGAKLPVSQIPALDGGAASSSTVSIRTRRATAATWTSANPILAVGERGFESDTGLSKTGDGATAWTTLAYEKISDGILATAVSGTQTATALSGTYLSRTGTKTDTSAGQVDWANDAASGYLLHLRTGANSTAAAAVIGIGTDQGSGNGILLSHKNTGKGIIATGQPGSGQVIELTSRGSGSGVWMNVQAGGGAVQVNARDGQGYADGTSTSSSTTFTSATAAFTAGDVGKSIVQLTSKGTTDPFGCIPSGTTIVFVTNATTIEMSQAATATGTAVLFNVAGRLPEVTQPLVKVMDMDLTTEIISFTRGGATFSGVDNATTPLTVKGKSGQTARIFAVLKNGDATPTFGVNADGSVQTTSGAYFNNAGVVGTAPVIATSYSSHASIKAGRSGAVTGDNFWAMGNGSTALSRFNKDGYFMTTKSAAPADADVSTGELALWFDTTNGAPKLMVKAKQADGTVITRSLSLALQSGTTASRPAAATVGVGAQYYDTTLSKPIWSNGTSWRDALGVAA